MNESTPAPDIFDMTQGESQLDKEPERESLSADVDQRPSKENKPSGMKDLIVKGVLCAAVVVGGVLIFMPDLLRGSGPARPSTLQTTFSPAEAMKSASEHAAEASHSTVDTRSDGHNVPNSDVDALLGTVPNPLESVSAARSATASQPPAVEVDLSEDRKQLLAMISELKATAADSNSRLALLEAAVLSNQRRLEEAIKVGSAPASSKKDVTPLYKRYRQGSNRGLSSAVLHEYKLNTIYPGMAWVQKSGEVYLIQVGDRIGDANVIGIDVAGRVVRTNRGMIR
nr:hypothetical protein [Pseudomonas sp. A46]